MIPQRAPAPPGNSATFCKVRIESIQRRIEQIQQDQQHVIIKMQLAIAGLVTVAASFVQMGKQPGHPPQLVPSGQVVGLNELLLGFFRHQCIMRKADSIKRI